MITKAVSCVVAVLVFLQPYYINVETAAAGYHYDPPSVIRTAVSNVGHYFAPISTVAPLPPVPDLPPLPTAQGRIPVPTLVQIQPAGAPANPTAAPAPSRPPTHRPTQFQTFTGNYREPSFQLRSGYPNGGQSGERTPETQLFLTAGTTPKPPLIGFRYPNSPGAPSGPSAPSGPAAPGFRASNGTPTRFTPAAPAQAGPQPLRVPFGREPVLSYSAGPDSDFYVVNGRQLKQYAVVEFVDNDLSQDTKPFLTQSFFNNYRAQVGASGTGAIAPLPAAMQLTSSANAIVQEQQRFGQGRSGGSSDTIALGSGGIGFIRLPDGSVTLGSGSLNFVTGQQHLTDQQEARTRSGSPIADPLHFGHGPFHDPSNRLRFK